MSELDRYIHYFSNLKRAPWNVVPEVSKGFAPHKPLLLLALIDLVENGSSISSFIDFKADIEKLNALFTRYWRKIIPTAQAANIAFPLAHLHNEPFWKCTDLSGQSINPSNTSSITQLQRLAVGARIDEELFHIMRLEEGRNALRNTLLVSCFSAEAQSQLSNEFMPANIMTSAGVNMSKLTENIRPALIGYVKQFIERASSGSQDLTQIPISNELAELSRKIGIYFKTSFGMGYPTKIPWLACFFPSQSASVEGVYPVILYRKEQRAVTVNYGVSATAQKVEGSWPRKWSDEFIKELPHFPDRKYGASYLYESFEDPQSGNYQQITDAFIKIIGDFLTLQNSRPIDPIPTPTPIPILSLEGISQIASRDFARASLRFQETSIVRYLSSLLTKRFVILTGLSGSGKTKLAHAFASWLSQTQDQYRLVAVGADWTSNENVLGYQDALQPTIYRKPASGALDLILRAENDPALPYFLILDEMNLSHVERYFADILSAIESGQEIALHASNEKLCSFAGDPLPVPAKIRLPENLFVVGTVNIDETTYMFSPKVLDRANVIEFRATVENIAGFLDAPGKVDMDALAGKGAGFGQAFVNSARNSVSLADLPPIIGNGAEIATNLKLRLTEVFSELVPIGAEFGFRTALEISSFFYHHAILNGSSWQFNAALDAQVIQKLMPKLHGSDRKLRPTLEKLKKFCEEHQLPLSTEKLNRMLDRLGQDGFTSFAEA